MKCLVAIKQVVDPYITVQLDSDNLGIDTDNLKKVINPFDEIALEEAIKLKEKNIITEIITVSINNNESQEILRQSLAMGADKAKLIKNDINIDLKPLSIAKILKKIALEENIELILMGKQSVDYDNNQTGQMLAGLLNWSQAIFASKIDININTKKATVVREVDSGLETIEIKLPSVITADLRLNEPRYISLPNIMHAKSKQLDIVQLSDLSLDLNANIKTVKYEKFIKSRKKIKVKNTDDLLNILKNKEQLIK